jgi:ribosomal protein L29
MKLITASELSGKTNFELSALYARLKEELTKVKPDSPLCQ